jgi:hypothetical protein
MERMSEKFESSRPFRDRSLRLEDGNSAWILERSPNGSIRCDSLRRWYHNPSEIRSVLREFLYHVSLYQRCLFRSQ